MVGEGDRQKLAERLADVLGKDEAMTLMESLPPVAWADLATKKDLEKLVGRREFELRLEVLEEHLVATFRGEMNQLTLQLMQSFATQTRMFIFTTIGTFIAFAGVVLGAIKLV
ncbi:MAG: hypothetical protein ACRDIU_09050 [Actinomycetota bacterium]